MGRYSKDFSMSGTPEEMYGRLRDYLRTQGYEETVYKGEKLLKKPDTFTTGPIFFKVTFLRDGMRIESWMKRAFLPGGAYVGEIAPNEVQGWAVKGAWKSCLEQIEKMFALPPAAAPLAQAAFSVSGTAASNAQIARQVPVRGSEPDSFCTACGAALKPGAVFCGKCGNRI